MPSGPGGVLDGPPGKASVLPFCRCTLRPSANSVVETRAGAMSRGALLVRDGGTSDRQVTPTHRGLPTLALVIGWPVNVNAVSGAAGSAGIAGSLRNCSSGAPSTSRNPAIAMWLL